MSLLRMLGLGVPWGYPSQGPARSLAGHLAAKGKDGLGKGRIYPEPCTPLLGGLQTGTQQSTAETPRHGGKGSGKPRRAPWHLRGHGTALPAAR